VVEVAVIVEVEASVVEGTEVLALLANICPRLKSL
jgi:hypothetical protein